MSKLDWEKLRKFSNSKNKNENIGCCEDEEDDASRLLKKCTTCGLKVYDMNNHVKKFHKKED